LTSIANGIIVFDKTGLVSIVDPLYSDAIREYYVSADQHVHELFLSGGVWQDGDLTSITNTSSITSAGSSLASLFDPNYHGVRTDYISNDQHVHEMFLAGGVWQDADLTTIAGGTEVSAGSGLVSILDPVHSTVRVYYIGSDQHVHELFLTGGLWQAADLTALTGTGKAAANSMFANLYDPLYDALRTYYIGADQHVHELFFSGDVWHDGDLTDITGAANAIAGSGLATLYDPKYKAIRTDYIGVDQKVHELFLSEGFWRDSDLPGIAVASGSGLASIIDFINKAVRLYYIGADQDAHELFLYDGLWHDADITAITDGPNAADRGPGTNGSN
ncbi:MAG: hypothetical protein WB992_10265, partial [Bryobacteraceae bacterium]